MPDPTQNNPFLYAPALTQFGAPPLPGAPNLQALTGAINKFTGPAQQLMQKFNVGNQPNQPGPPMNIVPPGAMQQPALNSTSARPMPLPGMLPQPQPGQPGQQPGMPPGWPPLPQPRPPGAPGMLPGAVGGSGTY